MSSHNSDTPSFYVAGLQRSGTNWLREYLTLNTDLPHADKPFWKHSMVQNHYRSASSKNVSTVVVVKSPYKWIKSIRRQPVDVSRHFRGKDYHGTDEQLIGLWCEWHRRVLDAVNPYNQIMIVKYEDILANPIMFLKQFANFADCNVVLPPKPVQYKAGIILPKERKDFYLAPDKDNDTFNLNINEYLDFGVMADLGYRVVKDESKGDDGIRR